MLSSPLSDQVVALLPSLKKTGQDSIYLGSCPFHSSQLSSLVVDYGAQSASCLSCGYGAHFKTLVDDLRSGDYSSPNGMNSSNRKIKHPVFGNSYGYLLTKEVGQSIHSHLFSKKVKQLNSAVQQLAHLISKMKNRIDPA